MKANVMQTVNRLQTSLLGWSERAQQRLPAELNLRNILLFCVIALLSIGTVMVMSASMPYASHGKAGPYSFLTKHLLYVVVAMVAAITAYRIPLRLWFGKLPIVLWLVTLLSLILVLVVGHDVNGSSRWLKLGPLTFQPSELAKFAMIIFTADYVVRRASQVRESMTSLLRLAIPVGTTVAPIVLEPDLGASAVIVSSVLMVFFLSGAPKKALAVSMGILMLALTVFIIFEPYRLRRVLSFSDPWKDVKGDGYQLSQSLIAFGRGEWFGQGLGHSIQKLSYLPEAHTDFMLAITAEELGFAGIATILTLSFGMVVCCMRIAHRALQHQHLRSGYLGYGIATIFLLQICVNAGMNMGMLPTKGLTMPFISYGGSSLVMCALMIGVMLRIERESQQPSNQQLT